MQISTKKHTHIPTNLNHFRDHLAKRTRTYRPSRNLIGPKESSLAGTGLIERASLSRRRADLRAFSGNLVFCRGSWLGVVQQWSGPGDRPLITAQDRPRGNISSGRWIFHMDTCPARCLPTRTLCSGIRRVYSAGFAYLTDLIVLCLRCINNLVCLLECGSEKGRVWCGNVFVKSLIVRDDCWSWAPFVVVSE